MERVRLTIDPRAMGALRQLRGSESERLVLRAGQMQWPDRVEYFVPADGSARVFVVAETEDVPTDAVRGDVVLRRRRHAYEAQVVGEPSVEVEVAELGVRVDRPWRSIAVVGSGRLGSNAAIALAEELEPEDLFLIDSDTLEDHSLDATECFVGDVGRPKVMAVRRFVSETAPDVRARYIIGGVGEREPTFACCRADLIVCAPDRDRARLAASMAALATMRPLLDLGTGIFDDEERGRLAGADVRLVLPGDGCLLCGGALSIERESDVDWTAQRAGSRRSLNQLAVAQGVELLVAYRSERIRSSSWVRLVLGEDGGVDSTAQAWVTDPNCPLCSRQTGRGTAVFDE